MNPLSFITRPVKALTNAVLMPFKAVFVVGLCWAINAMTYSGVWWVKWVARILPVLGVVVLAEVVHRATGSATEFRHGLLIVVAVAAAHARDTHGADTGRACVIRLPEGSSRVKTAPLPGWEFSRIGAAIRPASRLTMASPRPRPLRWCGSVRAPADTW